MDNDYDRLLETWKQFTYLKDGGKGITWDGLTVVPEGRSPARAKRQGALSTVIQPQRTDPEFGELLEAVAVDALTDLQQANVREIRREYERRLPYGRTSLNGSRRRRVTPRRRGSRRESLTTSVSSKSTSTGSAN